jgi:hypothetical protein
MCNNSLIPIVRYRSKHETSFLIHYSRMSSVQILPQQSQAHRLLSFLDLEGNLFATISAVYQSFKTANSLSSRKAITMSPSPQSPKRCNCPLLTSLMARVDRNTIDGSVTHYLEVCKLKLNSSFTASPPQKTAIRQ